MRKQISRLDTVVSSFKLYKVFGYADHRAFKKVIKSNIIDLT